MRKFRTAAVAAVTAAAISISGVSAASAATERYNFPESVGQSGENFVDATQDANFNGASTISSAYGQQLNADHEVTGANLLGDEVDPNAPKWAQVWRDGTYLAVIGAVLGGLIGAYNYAVYNGLFPHIFS